MAAAPYLSTPPRSLDETPNILPFAMASLAGVAPELSDVLLVPAARVGDNLVPFALYHPEGKVGDTIQYPVPRDALLRGADFLNIAGRPEAKETPVSARPIAGTLTTALLQNPETRRILIPMTRAVSLGPYELEPRAGTPIDTIEAGHIVFVPFEQREALIRSRPAAAAARDPLPLGFRPGVSYNMDPRIVEKLAQYIAIHRNTPVSDPVPLPLVSSDINDLITNPQDLALIKSVYADKKDLYDLTRLADWADSAGLTDLGVNATATIIRDVPRDKWVEVSWPAKLGPIPEDLKAEDLLQQQEEEKQASAPAIAGPAGPAGAPLLPPAGGAIPAGIPPLLPPMGGFPALGGLSLGQ